MRESLSLQEVPSDPITALYIDHHEVISRFARLFLGNSEDAAEVVQEIYVKLLEGRMTLPPMIERPWLYRVVLNACRDHRRSWWSRVKRGALDPSVLESIVDKRPTQETRLLDIEREVALIKALRDLPERFRAPVILRDVEELSYAEISSALGCGVGTVSSRLNRGRALVARRLRGGLR